MKKSIKIIIAVLVLALYLISMISFASALTIESVSMIPNEIAPGETSKIAIELENDGEEDIEDVSVNLVLISQTELADVPFAPFDSSSEISFDEIKEGKTKTAEFEIIALSDAKSGIYKIPVHIEYKENNETKTKDSLISIVVNSEPILGVDIEDGLLLKNKVNELRINVVNKGLSDVKFLEIEIGDSTYFDILSSKNVYIGNVNSDDFDGAEFQIFFKENIPNNIVIPISISYKDALNKKYTYNLNIQVKIFSKKKAIEIGLLKRNNTPIYGGVIFGLVVIYFIYKKIKKRRLKKDSI